MLGEDYPVTMLCDLLGCARSSYDHRRIAATKDVAFREPEIHHSDQGVQYAALAYTATLQRVQAQISMAEVGEAWQNGYAERVIRTIKEEEVDLAD